MNQEFMSPKAYSAFAERIYALVATIPAGKVLSYGQLAAMAGDPSAAQEVGHIMSRAPSHLPCHRVVNKTGSLAPEGVFGSQARQRRLLEEEGVTFTGKGFIDMRRHVWGEDEQLSLL